MRTYDIQNAGPKNRFMANGRIVSNSGSIVQLQNLFRNSLPDLDDARSLVKHGDYDALSMLYESVPEVLAQCVRTAFVPAEGMKFIVADFSSIEARVVSWVAGERWKMEAFRDGKDIYCETASRMFHVKVEKHGENGEYRQRGKQAELSCSYGGSIGALRAMGALDAGMKEDELQPLVEAWRNANPRIVQLWADVEEAAKTAIKEKTTAKTHGLVFTYRGGMLYIRLPSGRKLSYVKPRIGENRYGGEGLTYMGNDFARHWARIPTFGGKLVENCLSEGTLVITDNGLVPIEGVTRDMRVWDGEEYVTHNGVLYQGRQLVMTYDGLTATPDHKIYIEEHRKVALSELAGRDSTEEVRPVYDVLNAGSRHRFAVWNGERALIVSNCVQGISRDILCHAMEQLRDMRIVAHVHDEIIIECPMNTSVDEVCEKMARVPDWAKGLVLRADGYECKFYRKD